MARTRARAIRAPKVRTIVLTRAQLRAHAEREAKSMLGVSAKRAFRMLDTGELRGTIAACEMSMLRYMLESGQKSVARRRRKR